MDRVVLLLVVFVGNIFAFSQSDSLSSNFVSYQEKTTACLIYSDTSNSFFLDYHEGDVNHKTEFIPNTQEQLILGLSYKLVDVSFGFTPYFMRTYATDLKARQFNVGLRFGYKQWFQYLSFINQKGFFVDHNEMERFYLPNFRTTKIGGTTSYIFNEQFSYRTVFSQNQWQKKSSGSFIPNISFYYTNLDFNDSNISQSEIYTVSIAPAYFYNWIIKEKFLVSGGIALGGGINIIDKEINPLTEGSAYLKLAYNGESFFSYISSNGTAFLQSEKESQFNDSFSVFRIGVGYRFKTPEKIEKTYKNISDKIGL